MIKRLLYLILLLPFSLMAQKVPSYPGTGMSNAVPFTPLIHVGSGDTSAYFTMGLYKFHIPMATSVGPGTATYVPKFITTTTIGNSQIKDSVNIYIGSNGDPFGTFGDKVSIFKNINGTTGLGIYNPSAGANARVMWILHGDTTIDAYGDHARYAYGALYGPQSTTTDLKDRYFQPSGGSVINGMLFFPDQGPFQIAIQKPVGGANNIYYPDFFMKPPPINYSKRSPGVSFGSKHPNLIGVDRAVTIVSDTVANGGAALELASINAVTTGQNVGTIAFLADTVGSNWVAKITGHVGGTGKNYGLIDFITNVFGTTERITIDGRGMTDDLGNIFVKNNALNAGIFAANLTNLTLTASTLPATPASGVTLYSPTSTRLNIIDGNGNLAGLSTLALTASRVYTFPDNSGTLALLNSPAFTGVPTAPTATVGTNTTQVATTAFVLANSGGSSINFADAEVPSGSINSSNVTYTLAHTPTTGSVHLYRNGMRQLLITDYTISGSTITYTYAPTTGDTLITDYRY